MIQYPPYIDNVLPAFNNTISIPFEMNPAVSISMVKYFAIKFMDLQGKVKGVSKIRALSKMFTSKTITFAKDENISLPYLGFYKVQVAYLDGTETNYENLTYSSVGVIKRTYAYSNGVWQNGAQWANNLRYNGFSLKLTTRDPNEPIYKYRFKINRIDQNGNEKVFYQQEWQLHNTENDEIYIPSGKTYMVREANLSFSCNKVYTVGHKYHAVCEIVTLNGVVLQPRYSNDFIYNSVNSNTITGAKINYNQSQEDQEEGRISINIELSTNTPAGFYFVKRTSSKDNYKTWEKFYEFTRSSSDKIATTIPLKDYSIEQGVSYLYSLVKYTSKGIMTHEIFYKKSGQNYYQKADFEYIYLGDKDHSLKLKFNSAISGYKAIVQEQKQETLGGKYPFFFRNGDVNYKEFSISALLSYLMDEKETFISKTKIGIPSTYETHTRKNTKSNGEEFSSVDQYYSERQFKNLVYDWLNNGNIKTLRTPTEGNFVVRLSNISLSPFNGVNGLLHSFSATATEIEDFENFERLKELNLIL